MWKRRSGCNNRVRQRTGGGVWVMRACIPSRLCSVSCLACAEEILLEQLCSLETLYVYIYFTFLYGCVSAQTHTYNLTSVCAQHSPVHHCVCIPKDSVASSVKV